MMSALRQGWTLPKTSQKEVRYLDRTVWRSELVFIVFFVWGRYAILLYISMPVKDTGKDKRLKNLGVYSEGRLWKTYFFFSESRNSLGEQPRTRLTYREKAGNDEKFIFWARSVNETSSAESSLRSIIAAYSSIQSPAGRFVASLLTSVRYLGVTPSLFAYQDRKSVV